VADTNPEKSDPCRDLLLKQYPGARNLEESPVSVAGRPGRGFEMKWNPAGTSERLVRVAFVPSAAGMIEFTLVADLGKKTEASYAYKYLLASCLSNEKGKIKIVPQLDRS
jgi:hypothetical protein